MVDILSYVPRSVIMPECYGIKRDLITDLDELDDTSDYDDDTIFYDVFIQPQSRYLVALGPPLLNLERHLLPVETYVGTGRELCSGPLGYEINRYERFNALKYKLPSKYTNVDELSVRFVFNNGLTREMVAVTSPQEPVFLSMTTQQKNNRIEWMLDWALYHWKLGVELLILYDNGSDNLDEIVSAFEGLDEGPQIVMVHWPFKYGPPRSFGTNFCHTAQLNHAHLFFSQTTWSINLDVDEYVRLESPGSNLVSDLRAQPPSIGLLRIDSYWVPNIGQKVAGVRTVRDFPHRDKEPRGKGEKYILKSEAYKESRVHNVGLRKSFRARNIDPQHLAFLHYVAITTNWKGSYWNREKLSNFDRNLHVEDRSVIDVLEQLEKRPK